MFKKIFFLTLLCHAGWAFSMKNEEEIQVPQNQQAFHALLEQNEVFRKRLPGLIGSAYSEGLNLNEENTQALRLKELAVNLKALAKKDFAEQVAKLDRMGLTADEISKREDQLKCLNPLATWKVLRNEELLVKQLRTLDYMKKALESAKDDEDKNMLVAVCLEHKLHIKELPNLTKGLNLNEENTQALLFKKLEVNLKAFAGKEFAEQIEQIFLSPHTKRTFKELAKKDFAEQVAELDRMGLTALEIGSFKDELKCLNPLAAWKVLRNEELLKKQLRTLDYMKKALESAKDDEDKNMLVAVCLQHKLHEKELLNLTKGLNLNEENTLALRLKELAVNLKVLAGKDFDNQVAELNRMGLTAYEISKCADQLKCLNPLATWKVLKNEELLVKQLSDLGRAKLAWKEAKDDEDKNMLVAVCLQYKLHIKELLSVEKELELNEGNAVALKRIALAANKKSSPSVNVKKQSKDWDEKSVISYAPSSVASSVNTERFGQRCLQLVRPLQSPSLRTLEERSVTFYRQIENYARTVKDFDENFEEYTLVPSDFQMKNFMEHIQKHIISSALEHDLMQKEGQILLSGQDDVLIEDLHLDTAGRQVTAFALSKKDKSSVIAHIEALLTGATLLREEERAYPDLAAQIGITWRTAQPFDYFEFTRSQGGFEFARKKGRHVVGALTEDGRFPRTIYPIEDPEPQLETNVRDLEEEMGQLSLEPRVKKEEMKPEAPKGFKKKKRR